jgi:hypothetical protein
MFLDKSQQPVHKRQLLKENVSFIWKERQKSVTIIPTKLSLQNVSTIQSKSHYTQHSGVGILL